MIRLALTLFLVLAALPARAAVEIKEVVSPGGITAWLVEEHSIPFTAIDIRFKGGTSLEVAGKRGAINLMTGLLEEGAGDMDTQAFATEQEALAAKFEFESYDDALQIRARFLTEKRDESIALLKAAITDPRFDEEALERVRAQILAGIRADATDPDEIANEAFDAYAFGDHPYATPQDGTIESVSTLTRDDVVDAYRNVMSLDHLYVAVVGDITAEELSGLLDELLGDLPAEGAADPSEATLSFEKGITVVPFDSPQSVAIFGQPGIPRDHPDYFAAYIMTEILGGGREARLMTEVREKRGLTYGTGAYLVDYDYADLLMGHVRSANDKIAEAIEVIQNEWVRIAEEGVTEEELRDAKTYLTGAYPLRFDGNSRIARILASMQLVGLPIDYIATRNDRVNAVTMDDIKRVAAGLVQPENLHFVVVGQPEGLDATN